MPKKKTAPRRAGLAGELANSLTAMLRDGGYARGEALTERALAAQLRVSRSPVRSALALLERDGVVTARPGGGYAVADAASRTRSMAPPVEDRIYFRLVEDRMRGVLPERITENELLRRYALTRAQLSRLLRRVVAEGWMERLPGHGWAFLPIIKSLEAYWESYRFRLAIEPAAILEPGFILDVTALQSRRREQQALLDGDLQSASDAEIFERNSKLHETILGCSGNRFFVDSLKRINRLRRLMEYRQKLDRGAAVQRCHEHIVLIDALLAGRRKHAAMLLRAHLLSVGDAKTQKRPAGLVSED
jgi:DNA-binding GntR family transcriptional regulator